MSGQSFKKDPCEVIGATKSTEPWFERKMFCMFCGKKGEHFPEDCTSEDFEFFRKPFRNDLPRLSLPTPTHLDPTEVSRKIVIEDGKPSDPLPTRRRFDPTEPKHCTICF